MRREKKTQQNSGYRKSQFEHSSQKKKPDFMLSKQNLSFTAWDRDIELNYMHFKCICRASVGAAENEMVNSPFDFKQFNFQSIVVSLSAAIFRLLFSVRTFIASVTRTANDSNSVAYTHRNHSVQSRK